MIVFSEYRRADGTFTSQIVQGFRPADTDATAWLPGRYDFRSERVDIDSRAVVAYTPPDLPDEARNRRRVLAQIAALELRQARPLRELVRDSRNATARLRIDEIDIEIARLRAELLP